MTRSWRRGCRRLAAVGKRLCRVLPLGPPKSAYSMALVMENSGKFKRDYCDQRSVTVCLGPGTLGQGRGEDGTSLEALSFGNLGLGQRTNDFPSEKTGPPGVEGKVGRPLNSPSSRSRVLPFPVRLSQGRSLESAVYSVCLPRFRSRRDSPRHADLKKRKKQQQGHVARGCAVTRQEGRSLEPTGSDSPGTGLCHPGAWLRGETTKAWRCVNAALVFHQVSSEPKLDLSFTSRSLP